MRRSRLIGLAAVTCLTSTGIAHAHPTTEFDACVKVIEAAHCRDRSLAEPGVELVLEGIVSPHHARLRARAWERGSGRMLGRRWQSRR